MKLIEVLMRFIRQNHECARETVAKGVQADDSFAFGGFGSGTLLCVLLVSRKPQTEILLIESMAQHYWLKQRALRLQNFCFDDDGGCDEKSLALYLRYQTTHDRAFHKALNTLLELRADKRKARLDEAALYQRAEDSKKIGFVSQQSRERERAEAEARRQAAEKRREELHKWKVLRAEADVDHRLLQNLNLNRENPEYRRSVGAESIIAAEKAA